MTKKDLLAICTTKKATFKSASLGGKEIILRQLTINETDTFNEILKDESKNQFDAICFAVNCSMIDPTFFTDEELKELSSVGKTFINEVYRELPYIGMSKTEREEVNKKIEEFLKADKKIETEEEIEKK